MCASPAPPLRRCYVTVFVLLLPNKQTPQRRVEFSVFGFVVVVTTAQTERIQTSIGLMPG